MPKKVTREDRKLFGTRKYLSKKKSLHINVNMRMSWQVLRQKKIRVELEDSITQDFDKHYRIVDFLLVFSSISTLVKCVVCDGKVEFSSGKMDGLGFKIKVTCEKCKNPRFIPSSEKIGRIRYEINYRFAFVMRLLGLGLAGCDKFCGLMDLTSNFISRPAYSDYMKNICSFVANVTSKFLTSAIKEEKEETCTSNNLQDTCELTVSGDGTWKKRGFSSLYGVASLIGYYSGKVVDIFVKSSYCNDCKLWEKKLQTAEFEEWHTEHVNSGKCQCNHSGPAGNMEVDAIKQMFQRSMNNNVKYRNYIGDGDSKTYSGVLESKPYGEDFLIVKKECVGHVQKRMGTRLRDLVNKTLTDTVTAKGKKIKRKSLGGRGKLTGKMIDKLSVYYGLAIRRNHDSVEKMRNAIWATYYHYSSTDENPQHQYCPSGEESWCE